MAQSPLNDTAQPVDSEEEGRSSTMDKKWPIKKKLLCKTHTILDNVVANITKSAY